MCAGIVMHTIESRLRGVKHTTESWLRGVRRGWMMTKAVENLISLSYTQNDFELFNLL